MGSLARALETFFTGHGMAVATDQAGRLAAGRRQRRIERASTPSDGPTHNGSVAPRNPAPLPSRPKSAGVSGSSRVRADDGEQRGDAPLRQAGLPARGQRLIAECRARQPTRPDARTPERVRAGCPLRGAPCSALHSSTAALRGPTGVSTVETSTTVWRTINWGAGIRPRLARRGDRPLKWTTAAALRTRLPARRGERGGLLSRLPSPQAKPSSRGRWRQGCSYSGALQLDVMNHARSAECGSTEDGMGAGASGGLG